MKAKFLEWSTVAIYASKCINTSYLTDSYIVFTLKQESVSKNTISALKMMVKSGLEKYVCGIIVIFITEFVILGTFMK